MKALMVGWEFPPFFAGGIGVVCYELSQELATLGVEVTYIMPFGPQNYNPGFLKKMLVAEKIMPNIKVHKVDTLIQAYMTEDEYQEQLLLLEKPPEKSKFGKKLYGDNLLQEVHNFAHRAMNIAQKEDFDIIHCHDWLTIPAALGIKQLTGKPLIVHIHNTVFDRYLSGGNTIEYDIEKRGFEEADKIICISNYVKRTVVEKYGIDPAKCEVVWNAKVTMAEPEHMNLPIQPHEKVVLYAGRVALQKGPTYFVQAAKLVLEHNPNVRFILAGSGHQLDECIGIAHELGIADKCIFPGFFTQTQGAHLFEIADIFVLPSASEPFGLTPLEAISKGTPTIISKQTGVAELLNHVITIDFWDTHELAEKILSILKYEELHNTLKQHGLIEVETMTWNKAAQSTLEVYRSLV